MKMRFLRFLSGICSFSSFLQFIMAATLTSECDYDNTEPGIFNSRRSAVLTTHAAASSDQPLATEIGLEILKKGGNAADAAVAMAAALALTIPHSTGLGGDCFCLFYRASEKKVYGINGSGRSPQALTLDYLHSLGYNEDNLLPMTSGLAVTVPGAAAGWSDAIELFGSGKFNLSQLLQPTIRLAEEGFPVTKVGSINWKVSEYKLQESRFGSELLINGKAPEEGQIFRNPYFAETLRELSKGKENFYTGRIAQKIVDEVQYAGGVLTMEDMRHHLAPSESTLVEPISTEYGRVRLWEIPPNSQGLVALLALNILKGFDLEEMGHNSAQYLHTLAQAFRIAFADGLFFIADPKDVPVRLEDLLSDNYAAQRRSLFDPDRAEINFPHGDPTGSSGPDTTYWTVVDEEGNACSFINSVYYAFGTGLVGEGTGFSLQNRALTFRMIPDHPNVFGPRKRPYQTIIPAMLTDAHSGELLASYGVMGGYMQPQGHVQVLLNMALFGMDPQEALNQPRICIKATDPKERSVFDVVLIEEGIPTCVTEELEAKGHKLKTNVASLSERQTFGRGHVITNGAWWRKDNPNTEEGRVLWSGSDPRSDGVPYGY